MCALCPGGEKVTPRTLSLPQSLSWGPGPAGAAGNRSLKGTGGVVLGHSGHRGGREAGFMVAFHMVGFTINFECLCGSIKFPMVVYREYESTKLVAKTG